MPCCVCWFWNTHTRTNIGTFFYLTEQHSYICTENERTSFKQQNKLRIKLCFHFLYFFSIFPVFATVIIVVVVVVDMCVCVFATDNDGESYVFSQFKQPSLIHFLCVWVCVCVCAKLYDSALFFFVQTKCLDENLTN